MWETEKVVSVNFFKYRCKGAICDRFNFFFFENYWMLQKSRIFNEATSFVFTSEWNIEVKFYLPLFN